MVNQVKDDPKNDNDDRKKENASLRQSFSPQAVVNRLTDTRAQRKCEVCGTELALDETQMEHIVSIHLTVEGLCEIFGEDIDIEEEHD